MFEKQKKSIAVNDKTTGTIIGEGLMVEGGSIKGSGNVRIDGRFSGEIRLGGHIIIGTTGYVEGEITANSALFAGEFKGNMTIAGTVHLAPDSKVSGQIHAEKIIMDEDAIFNGQCTMITANAEKNEPVELFGKSAKQADSDSFDHALWPDELVETHRREVL